MFYYGNWSVCPIAAATGVCKQTSKCQACQSTSLVHLVSPIVPHCGLVWHVASGLGGVVLTHQYLPVCSKRLHSISQISLSLERDFVGITASHHDLPSAACTYLAGTSNPYGTLLLTCAASKMVATAVSSIHMIIVMQLHAGAESHLLPSIALLEDGGELPCNRSCNRSLASSLNRWFLFGQQRS